MANPRDLAKDSSTRIWRTVVFAGAMLAAPVGCGSKAKPAETTTTTPSDADKAAADKAAADQAAADKAAADKAAADQAAADQAAADKAAADKAAADQAAADAAAAEAAQKRPRGGNARPTGRGFVLA